MALTFDEIKERIRDREDADTIIDFLGITIDDIVDSNLLDGFIQLHWNLLQDVYEDDGSIS